MNDTLIRIADCITRINTKDLTVAEKNIAKILMKEKVIELVTCSSDEDSYQQYELVE